MTQRRYLGLGPAVSVISMARSRWSLRTAKSDRLLGPAASALAMARSRWSLRAAESDKLLVFPKFSELLHDFQCETLQLWLA